MGVMRKACRRRRRVGKYLYKDRGHRPRSSIVQYLFRMAKVEGEKMKESGGYRGT